MRSLSRSPASLNEQEQTLSNENSSSFDPRRSRRRSPSAETEECEPMVTPRSSRGSIHEGTDSRTSSTTTTSTSTSTTTDT